jgi:NAD(P)-dependent dehydrogenase (short-subunit alcohol dehydrogenase family)
VTKSGTGASSAPGAGRAATDHPRFGQEGRGGVALVTGGSRGLGLSLARELARHGFRLAICARDTAELADAESDLTERGAEVLTVPCDIAERDQAEHVVAATVDRFGRLDVLVNNAGIIQVAPFAEVTVDDFAAAQAVMFWGTLHPALAALPHLRATGHGRIVNITSVGGKISFPHLLPYNCAKFAAVGFSEGLRAELAGSGVTVTTVVPGLMRTGSHLRAFFKGQQHREFTWFAIAATLPGLSTDAEWAARRIVRAGLAGRPEVILTPAAKLGIRVQGLFPATTARALGAVNRLLPKPTGAPGPAITGRDASAQMNSALVRGVTALGRSAARRLHQHAGPEAGRG